MTVSATRIWKNGCIPLPPPRKAPSACDAVYAHLYCGTFALIGTTLCAALEGATLRRGCLGDGAVLIDVIRLGIEQPV